MKSLHESLMQRDQERGHSNATTALMSLSKFGKKDVNMPESLRLDLELSHHKTAKRKTYEVGRNMRRKGER